MTKLGLTNSEGCTDRPPALIHRVAPLISSPTKGIAANRTRATAKFAMASRRMPRGASNDVEIITTKPKARNTN